MRRESNDRIFNNQIKEVEELFEEIKELSWRWCLSRMNIAMCLFHEWRWNPKKYLKQSFVEVFKGCKDWLWVLVSLVSVYLVCFAVCKFF